MMLILLALGHLPQGKKLRSIVQNSSLRSKIICIVLIAMILMTGVSAVCLKMTVNAGNAMFYKALAGSLSYTAGDIATKLSNIESMTNMIITNSEIRKNLIILLDEEYEIKKKNAKSNLERLLTDYHQTYKSNNIAYISLYSNDVSITSYAPGAASTPEHIHTGVITETKMNAGYPIWDTDHCNTHGLFLGREARQVNHLSFRTLGTLVVCLDIEKMIATSTESAFLSDNIQYLLINEENHVFYRSDNFTQKQAAEISRKVVSGYQVLNINKSSYFAVKGNISPNEWQYICLVPYEEMEKTIYATQILVAVLLIVTLCLVLFLSHKMTRIIVSDITVLVNEMRDFFKDDAMLFKADALYQNRKDEIGILHKQFKNMVLQIQHMIRQNYISEILAKEAQLKALENQINPHFLYNTLEMIKSMIDLGIYEEAGEAITTLARFYRYSLSKGSDIITIGTEIEIVKQYLYIEKLRHMEYFDYEIDCERDTKQYVIPKLILQPILENAIVHGTTSDGRMCFVSLRVQNIEDVIVITVKDDGNGIASERLQQLNQDLEEACGEEKDSFGLFSINRRVRLLYGTEYGIKLKSEFGKGTSVILRIPKLEHLEETVSAILERDENIVGGNHDEETGYHRR